MRNEAIETTISKIKKSAYRKFIPKKVRYPLQVLRGKSIYKDYYLEKQCIFLHIPKAAGQSIATSLFADKKPGHWFYRDFEWEDEDKAKEFFTFTIVRNPLDRLVSAYFYLKGEEREGMDAVFRDNFLSEYKDFESLVLYGLKDKNIYSWIHFIPQVEFLKDRNGDLVVNYIGKMENIHTAYDEISKKIGVTKELSEINKSTHKSYESYYSDHSLQVAKEFYKDDFRLLGYE